jgi:uridine kinase
MFDELVKVIESQLAEKPHVVVGITGFGGSGKTTLTKRLREYFAIPDAQVVYLDNIFAENHAGKLIFEDYDWPVITRLLEDVQDGDRLKYQGRGFLGEPIPFDQPLPKVVIIEGVRLFRPEVMDYFDTAVWIDCPPELATQRGEQRDRDDGNDEQHINRWRSEWLPKDQEYYTVYKPQELATFLYKN